MKKFISFALAASMALSMVPATAFASSDLTASHSNIRVTANTEFGPEGREDTNGNTYKDTPYILIEATSNFVSKKQTFEVVLENAEWLERDNNSDIAYVEDEEIMAKYLQFELGGSDSSTTGGTTSTPTASVNVGRLEQEYLKAAQDLKTKADAYISAVTAVQDAINSYADAISAAQTAYDDAQAVASAAKKEYDELVALQNQIDTLKTAYEEAYATTQTKAYQLGSESPTLHPNPEDTSASAGEGAFKCTFDSTNNYCVSDYWVDADGSAITAADTAGMVSAINDATDKQLSADGVEAKDGYEEYINAKGIKDDTDKKISAAKASLQKAGATVTADIVDTSGVDAKVSNAKTIYDNSVINEENKKNELDRAQAAYDAAAGADVQSTKTAFEEALKVRTNAAVTLMNEGGSDYEEKIVGLDSRVGLATTTSATDSTLIYPQKYQDIGIDKVEYGTVAIAGAYTTTVDGETLTVTIDKKSDTRIVVTTDGYKFRDGDVIKIPLFVRTTGGVASVSIDSLNSEFTSEGKTFARTADGDTNLTIEKTQSFYDEDEIKNIYIEELIPGTIEKNGVISLRVNGDFKLKRGREFSIERITGNGLEPDLTNNVYTDSKCEEAFTTNNPSDEIYINIDSIAKSTEAVQYRIKGLLIVEDGADFGDEASITVSGGGTTKQTVTIGTYEDYGVKLTAEDKELPVIYAGTKATSKYDNQTLKVTIEETVANSFIDNRKMELTLPDGVEFVADNGSIAELSGNIDQVTEDFKAYNFKGTLDDVKSAFTVDADGGKITITSKDLEDNAFDSSGVNKDRKRKIEFSVHVSADAAFTGDVVMTLSGAAVANQSVSATIATVKAPIEVKTTANELKIDYRNTDVADITLVEPEAGLWSKDDEIYIEGEKMSFETGAKAEVVSGDMKLAKLDGDNVEITDSDERYDSNNVLKIKVDSRSSKTPAEIKLSNLSLYMDRSLAAGDYKLKVYGSDNNDFFMNNYHYDGDDLANGFETSKVTVMNDFVKVVTAGRDKDDATFTTTIVVPVGSDVITAGTKEIKLSEMEGGACPPAYINNDGYTMLPVRAVTEALNDIAAVRWDDATKTCTIGFGQRVFSMTVGSKVLNMNGVSTALNAAPEIRDGRVFLPLRDLGYALGLSESQISWDATTQTAKLN